MSATESLSIIASKIFGTAESGPSAPQDPHKGTAGTVDAMMAFAKVMNGGG